MADKTRIEWTDATWNPITGCSVVSAGCRHCYAMKLAGTRLQHHPSRSGLTVDTKAGPVWTGEVRLNEEWLDQPLRWRRPRRIFVCAHSDLFHESVPVEWISRVLDVMAQCPQHTFQVLTKRAARMQFVLWSELDWKPLPNVWLGVSVEDQAAADERIPLLLETPAAVRWVSVEPLLGPVDMGKWLDPWTCSDCGHHGGEYDTGPFMCADCSIEVEYAPEIGSGRCPKCGKDDGTSDDVGGTCPKCGSVRGWSRDYGFKFDSEKPALLDWVVVGGESGASARPMHPRWVRSLRDQCAAADVPFLFKQWGEWVPSSTLPPDTTLPYERWGWIGENGGPVDKMHDRPFADESAHHELMARMGKTRAGRLIDGMQHDGYPGGAA